MKTNLFLLKCHTSLVYSICKRSIWTFLLLFACFTATFGQATITITPSTNNPIAPNSTLTFDVTVENYTNILTSQFAINWDANILEFVSIDVPNGVDFPGLSTANFGTSFVNTGIFYLSWLEPSVSAIDVADGTSMFSFTMKGLTNGTSTVSIDPNETQEIIDGNFNDIGLIAKNTEVVVLAGAAANIAIVPTMTDWGLFLFALVMLNFALVFIYNKKHEWDLAKVEIRE